MRFAVLGRSADLRVPPRCQTAQPAQKATELGQGAHALPRSPMIHTGWFRQCQPRSRAAAQKLVAIESTLSIRAAGFRAARLRMVLFVRPFAGTDPSPLLDVRLQEQPA